jgi:hypothetical protein
MASDANVNFSRWETDFAIRLRKPQKGEFTISKLADIRLFLFEPVSPPSAPLISCYPEALDWTAESRQLMARRRRRADAAADAAVAAAKCHGDRDAAAVLCPDTDHGDQGEDLAQG